jgi:hypothetical protein
VKTGIESEKFPGYFGIEISYILKINAQQSMESALWLVDVDRPLLSFINHYELKRYLCKLTPEKM